MPVHEIAAPAPASPSARVAGRKLSEGVVRTARAVGLATVIAFGFSLQFFAQLFVWLNWPVSEVFEGWLYIFRDRLTVAISIALAITVLGALRPSTPFGRSVVLATGVATGAVAGETVVSWFHGQYDSIGETVLHALRWSVVALGVAATYYMWRASSDSHEQLRREVLRRQSLEQQLTNMRLTALRKQIEPHFLFNTLATVRRLHQVDPANGAKMLAGFIDYLRRLLPLLDRSEIPLGEEIDLVEAYLCVIRIRMSGRLQVKVDVPVELRRARVPTLALATLVENAIKHGLAPMPAGGDLSISAAVRNGRLEVCVADTGVGLKPGSSGGTGIGLYNVRARLDTLYGADASLRIQSNSPAGVRATLALPLQANLV
jgi:signal transduction histidine kinase